MQQEKTPVKATLSTPQPSTNIRQHFEPLLSAEQAAQLLGGMHTKTLQRMARNNEVPAYRIGRFWLFRASELNGWLQVQSSRQPVRVN